MKFLNLNSFFRISILAIFTMFAAGPIGAQTLDTRPSTATDRDYNSVRTDRDNHHDWGWIGLLGLIGLAGLLPKNRKDDYDRSDTGNRTSNR